MSWVGLLLPYARWESIDGLLQRISSGDALGRDRAQRELLEVKPDWVAGLSRRIDTIADRAWSLAEQGLLMLAQRRQADSDYSYFAIMSKRLCQHRTIAATAVPRKEAA